MLSFIQRLKNTIDKKRFVIEENLNLAEYSPNIESLEVTQKPFPHLVQDDFFTKEIHTQLRTYFTSILSRGTTQVTDFSRFHPFVYANKNFQYDGYLYVPKYDEDPALKLFYTHTWNSFFSNIFSQPTGFCTSLALHYHPPGDRTGFVHSDYALKIFSELDKTEGGVIYRDRGNGAGVKLLKQTRAITLIYYLDLENETISNEGGGETGLYLEKESAAPCKLIEPKDNRLFAFKVSPTSFHAFQANTKPRATIIQWFHVDPEWSKKTYGVTPVLTR